MKKLLILAAVLILTTSAGCCQSGCCGWCRKGAPQPCPATCVTPGVPCSPCESAPCVSPGAVVPGPEVYSAPAG